VSGETGGEVVRLPPVASVADGVGVDRWADRLVRDLSVSASCMAMGARPADVGIAFDGVTVPSGFTAATTVDCIPALNQWPRPRGAIRALNGRAVVRVVDGGIEALFVADAREGRR
jgi:carbohydrate-binding DOMON domain-containing protein